MPVTALKKQKKGASKRKRVVVSKKIKDHSNDPFFVKKAKAAEAFLKKHGLPAVFTR
jgi:hypothetical protein